MGEGWMRGINATVSRRADSDFAGGPQGPRKRMQYCVLLHEAYCESYRMGWLSRPGTKVVVGQFELLATVSRVRVLCLLLLL